ncbi:MAG: hypothetical protein FWH57_02255 [Oscillospiraceae bacterium]|nr:hypothetical protein [Oscillospiraceae bacterium]
MKTLSYTQEYFLCAVNSMMKAHFAWNSAFPACLVVGGIKELLDNEYIVSVGNGDLVACKKWDEGLAYLKPLFQTIMTLRRYSDDKGIVGVFASTLNSSRYDDLFDAVGDSLVQSRYAEVASEFGTSKKKMKYQPKAEAVKSVIDRFRAELARDGTLPEETICLLALLDKSSLIRDYIGKSEMEIARRRIEETKNSDIYAFADAVINCCDDIAVAAM